MKKAILAEKVGMTQVWNDQGQLIPVTVLAAGPCDVLQVKTVENDGYEAVQVGFGTIKEKIVTKDGSGKKVVRNAHGATKAEVGHAKKAERLYQSPIYYNYHLYPTILIYIYLATPQGIKDLSSLARD